MNKRIASEENRPAEHAWKDAALLLAVILLTNLFVLGFGFVYDDHLQIADNPQLRSWRYLPGYFTHSLWSFYNLQNDNYYRPLLLVWMRVCYALFGLREWAWHLSTLLCHAAAAILCLRWLRAIGVGRTAALLTALLFALHPAHVENIAWCSAVNDPLLAVFVFSAMILHARAAQNGRLRTRVGAALCCLAALLAKETAIVLPLLLSLQAFLFDVDGDRRRRLRASLRNAWPYWAAMLLALSMRVFVLGGLAHAKENIPLLTVLYTLPQMLVFYLRLLLWPTHLSCFYTMDLVTAPTAAFWLPTSLLLVLAIALALIIRRLPDPRRAGFGAALLLLPLLPCLHFPSYNAGEMTHDRYLYLPLAGFALLACEMARGLARRWPMLRPRLLVLATLAIFALACQSMIVEQNYRNELSYFAWGFRNAPDNPKACEGYSNVLFNTGHRDEMAEVLEHTLRVNPRQWYALRNLGRYYFYRGRQGEAEALLRRAIALREDDMQEHFLLGLCLLNRNAFSEALGHLQRASQLEPTLPDSHMALAVAWHGLGEPAKALAEAQAEMRLQPKRAQDVREQLRLWGMDAQ